MRTLRELIEVSTRWVTQPRRSLKRVFDLSDATRAMRRRRVHHAASAERLVSTEPDAVDNHRRAP